MTVNKEAKPPRVWGASGGWGKVFGKRCGNCHPAGVTRLWASSEGGVFGPLRSKGHPVDTRACPVEGLGVGRSQCDSGDSAQLKSDGADCWVPESNWSLHQLIRPRAKFEDK